jgi:hypothetical protein
MCIVMKTTVRPQFGDANDVVHCLCSGLGVCAIKACIRACVAITACIYAHVAMMRVRSRYNAGKRAGALR